MHGQTNDSGHESGVVQFARGAKGPTRNEGDQLDKAGQTLLQLVQNAAGVAEENSRRSIRRKRLGADANDWVQR